MQYLISPKHFPAVFPENRPPSGKQNLPPAHSPKSTSVLQVPSRGMAHTSQHPHESITFPTGQLVASGHCSGTQVLQNSALQLHTAAKRQQVTVVKIVAVLILLLRFDEGLLWFKMHAVPFYTVCRMFPPT